MNDALNEYLKRLQPFVQIESLWAKDNAQLIEWIKKRENCLSLDPQGQLFTSEGFSQFLIQQWEKGGSRLTLLIGERKVCP